MVAKSPRIEAQGALDTKVELPYSLEQFIRNEAILGGVDPDLLIKVAVCESSLRTDVYGDGGRAFGVYQYHLPTFEWFSKLKGEELDYYSPADQVRLTVWAFANGYENHWSCLKKVR